jgi:hypothetical protein
MLTHLIAIPKSLFIKSAVPKGAVCQHYYSLEQAGWVNQTVPLGFYETRNQ